jgi:ribonuclease T1
MLTSLRFSGVLLAALLWLPHVQAGPMVQPGIPAVPVAELPPEARDTLHAIKQGGPFAYPRDGVVFKNYERVLPVQPRGYYREYTVKTPKTRNRGTRRIISGKVNEYYYTADHYKTFKRILE